MLNIRSVSSKQVGLAPYSSTYPKLPSQPILTYLRFVPVHPAPSLIYWPGASFFYRPSSMVGPATVLDSLLTLFFGLRESSSSPGPTTTSSSSHSSSSTARLACCSQYWDNTFDIAFDTPHQANTSNSGGMSSSLFLCHSNIDRSVPPVPLESSASRRTRRLQLPPRRNH